MKNNIKDALKRLARRLVRFLQWVLIILAWVIYIVSWLAILVIPYWIIIYPILHILFRIYVLFKHKALLFYGHANVIVHGGRRTGKGLIFQYLINKLSSA